MDCVDAGNVLVHLFLQTDTRYVLTNKKLQYLLIIAQMTRLSQNELLFDDDIRNFRQSLVIDTIGNNFLSDSDIVSGIANDMPIKHNATEFVIPFSKKKIYEIAKMPSNEDKGLLMSVFLAFGAYQEITLRRMLYDFKELRDVPAFSVVPKDNIRDFFRAALSQNQHMQNRIFNFIEEQHSESTINNETEENYDLHIEPVNKPIPKPTPAETPVLDLENIPVVVARRPKIFLEGLSSLRNIVAGKQYSILVELSSPAHDCQINVLALSSNKYLDVFRKRLSDTLYRFTFVGIASDIKISANIIS